MIETLTLVGFFLVIGFGFYMSLLDAIATFRRRRTTK